MTLAEYLVKEHLSETAFARIAGVTQSTVHRWVHGKRLPSVGSLPKIERGTRGKVKAADFYSHVQPVEGTVE